MSFSLQSFAKFTTQDDSLLFLNVTSPSELRKFIIQDSFLLLTYPSTLSTQALPQFSTSSSLQSDG